MLSGSFVKYRGLRDTVSKNALSRVFHRFFSCRHRSAVHATTVRCQKCVSVHGINIGHKIQRLLPARLNKNAYKHLSHVCKNFRLDIHLQDKQMLESAEALAPVPENIATVDGKTSQQSRSFFFFSASTTAGRKRE
ncbi:hypothetical protein IscW_ISCW018340 [Ixodes scapularis]|uniref:Uncharacterized protein n=1 Tax=Ixodes scapularis TaxID=6945 RepID=B7PFI3_IXOSC|nr:hypothetical protein IscW_ISCW018340 [Ixodes scapularis]|eukprot:XP_002433955.1 hypothetical protein IscW_ISCW018340 [Ixodes scapularis]